jgi:hypothetical protein
MVEGKARHLPPQSVPSMKSGESFNVHVYGEDAAFDGDQRRRERKAECDHSTKKSELTIYKFIPQHRPTID